MKVVIVDNELIAVQYLTKLLDTYEDVTIEKSFLDSVEAMIYLLNNPCDVIFLDIEMPNINGIYIAEHVIEKYPKTKVCFITGYNEFAVKAFELNVIDYILKPFTKERLDQTITKLKVSDNTDYSILNELGEDIKFQLNMICGYDDEDIVLLNYKDIYYVEMLERNIFIHTKDKVLKGNKTLNFYESKLNPYGFYRTHKSYIVNLNKMSKMRPRINYTYDVIFRDIKDIVPISRHKVKELKEFFKI
ncbi:LytR/AlgR family response regulator transcription factor [Anaeromicropila populeti]|uniref:Stage 0 sporulation protein A homolog n=1 Tax=Anaeromicropila populeti TaxID=37658 RepID=A0A1I6JVP7_9FIRM|nr:LytTR family DNA-binding domain-containing protein [Anaeromicropila populeti]SFR83075.1 two component transcriptional regulator, LytTR family [Anaeromicropila populeti]